MQRDKKIVFDLLDVRFGSLAALQDHITLTAAFGESGRQISLRTDQLTARHSREYEIA